MGHNSNILTTTRGLLAAAAALGIVLGMSATLQAAPLEQPSQARVVVVGYPDLTGVGSDPGCPGCDKVFNDSDTVAAASDPLPLLEFVILDNTGMEIGRNMTSALSDGRRPTSFLVDAPGDYTVALAEVPDGWALCTDDILTKTVSAGDFDTDQRAQLDFWLWHGCVVPTPTATAPATATNPVTPPAFTATPTVPGATSTVVPTAASKPTSAGSNNGGSSGGGGSNGNGGGSGSGGSSPSSSGAVPQTMAAQGAAPTISPSGSGVMPSGEIRGLVYGDANADGGLGPTEPGIGGVTVRLTGQGIVREQTTPPAGTYAFGNLPPGVYDVQILLRPEQLTTTDRYSGINIDGNTVMGNDFGLRPAVAVAAGPAAAPADGLHPRLPSTGRLPAPTSRLLMAIATVIGALSLVGLVLESNPARRTRDSQPTPPQPREGPVDGVDPTQKGRR